MNAGLNWAKIFVKSIAINFDEAWDAAWKVTNGLRLWCVDRETNGIVHLGGEYTWGNCEKVGLIVERLIESGYLPADGNYGEDDTGEGVIAQVTWVTDGMPWFEQHILKKFPEARVILDAYHLLQRVASFAAEAWGRGKKKSLEFNRQAYVAALGVPRLHKEKAKKRKGHRKHRRAATVVRLRELETTRFRLTTTNAWPISSGTSRTTPTGLITRALFKRAAKSVRVLWNRSTVLVARSD